MTVLWVAMGGVLFTSAEVTGQGLGGRLYQKRHQKQSVRAELRNIKAEQATRRNALTRAQVEAEQARQLYWAAKNELQKTRAELRAARQHHAECVARLKAHDAAVCSRLVVIYELGEPSYMEVLLNATSFADFVERADFMQRVVQADANLLDRYTNERKVVEALQRQLEAVQAKQEHQTRQLHQRKAVAEAKEAYAARLLRQANTERAAAEQQLAEIEQVEKEIEQLIRQVQSNPAHSALAYGGQWRGWGSPPLRHSYRVSSGFGMRFHPILHRYIHHPGVDLACPAGTPIHAAATGRVVHAGWWGPLGKAVLIDHGGGWSTVYGHCSQLACSPGQYVTAGDVIGYVGSTGRSTGPHLHYGVRRYGVCVNPAGAY
ncbi:MAG: murein hydrolase activator EnvC family protein [Candidatus Zipacnadales bacterium]